MKKYNLFVPLLLLTVSLSACSTKNNTSNDTSTKKQEDKINLKKEEKKNVDVDTLKEQALNFPLEITDSKILVQDDKLKNLYPDLYSVTVKNNSDVDIKEYEVALLGWDENDLPVKIKGDIDFSDGSYTKKLVASDVNLVSGATDGDDGGMGLDKNISLKTLQPVIISFTDFDDNVTKNKNAEPFIKAIEGKKIK